MAGESGAAALTPEALMRAAEVEAGLCDWGEPAFHRALELMCRSARDEARLEGAAREGFAANLRRLMGNRLRLYADRSRHPQIAEQKIISPLVVTGLPRGGTTILHSLLSQDPDARSPQKWEIDFPSPPPRRETYDCDPRIAVTAAAVEQLDPQFRAMHQVEATLPDECNAIMTMTFRSLNFPAATPLQSYTEWLIDEADMRSAYRRHLHVLQHMQAFAPRRYWVLKAPPHLLWLDVLLETYPDAKVVMAHRDPAEALPSLASLIAFLRRSAGEVDPIDVGEEQLRIWGTAIRKAMAYRTANPNKGQFFDVYYRDFLRDPLATVRAVYQHFGLPLTEAAEAAMRRFLAANQQNKHGRHEYTPETFGMSKGRLRQAFGDYIERYAVPTA
jgi:hypothetical protein